MEDSSLEAGARLSVSWWADEADHPLNAMDHVANYTRTLVEALHLAGWQPRRLDAGMRVTPSKIVQLDVEGEVPGLDQAGFARLASVAIASCNLWQVLPADAEIRLRPRLIASDDELPAALPPVRPVLHEMRAAPPLIVEATSATPARAATKPRLATRVIVAVLFGGLLGLFGLPRLLPSVDVPAPAPVPAAQPLPTLAPTAPPPPTPVPVAATAIPTQVPTPTAPPTSVAIANVAITPLVNRVLFAERFVNPLPGWPHVPDGTAWFANGRYELAARDPGRFVAVQAPLNTPVGDVAVSGRFRKTGGPPGGGYGFIVRSQGTTELDGTTQQGRYIVLEIGDRGDIGIWQREESRWIDILPWTPSTAVHQGTEANELLVTTQGRRVRFVVNGVEVANMTYNALPAEGGIGVFVGGDLNEVSLEWLIVETPDPNLR